MLVAAGVADPDLSHVRERVYTGIKCNWKVCRTSPCIVLAYCRHAAG